MVRWIVIVKLALTVLLLSSCATVRAQDAPPQALTDSEQLRIENLNLLRELQTTLRTVGTCGDQLAQLRGAGIEQLIQERQQQVRADVEKRTGKTWDPATGVFSEPPAPNQEKTPR